MILTGEEIEKGVDRGDIVLSPFVRDNLNPNSYNYHLGSILKISTRYRLDTKDGVFWKKIVLPQEGFTLNPGRVYLASTKEEIGSSRYVTTLIGRSSVGRLGLFVQVSAELGHIGTGHCWTLELTVVQPVTVYPGIQLGQVCFWYSHGSMRLYTGRYTSHNEPVEPYLDSFGHDINW